MTLLGAPSSYQIELNPIPLSFTREPTQAHQDLPIPTPMASQPHRARICHSELLSSSHLAVWAGCVQLAYSSQRRSSKYRRYKCTNHNIVLPQLTLSPSERDIMRTRDVPAGPCDFSRMSRSSVKHSGSWLAGDY